MITKVKKYMEKYHMVQAGDQVIVGLSGGADSVCLLFLLQRLSLQMQFSLQAVHVNHKLRKEADDEARFVKELCKTWMIPCKEVTVNVRAFAEKEHLCLEEAARALRYQVFEEYQKDGKGTKIALAHHENDQAETVLFHLFRGSGIKGLTGMRPVRDCYIRPLLCVNKDEILAYVKENNLQYVTDESNFDTTYARNKIRHELLPAAEKEICSGSISNIAKSAEITAGAVDFLEQEIDKACRRLVQKTQKGCFAYKDELLQLHPYLCSAVIYEMLSQTCGKKRDIGKRHVDGVLELLQGQSGRQLCLIYGLFAFVDQHKLWIECDVEKEKVLEEIRLELTGETRIPNTQQVVRCRVFPYEKGMTISRKTYTKWFDCDKINNCPVLRSRTAGDFFYCSDTDRKKIQDYFVDEKISARKRDKMLLIADGSHIMWIPGYRISNFYKVTDTTKQVLEISIIGGKENE